MYFDAGKPSCSLSVEEYGEMKRCGLFFQSWSGCIDAMSEPSDEFYIQSLTTLRDQAKIPILIVNGELDTAQTRTNDFVAAAGATLFVLSNAKHEAVLSEARIGETLNAVTGWIELNNNNNNQ